MAMVKIAIIANEGGDSLVAQAVGRDRKGRLSLVLYLSAILLAFVSPWIAAGLYVVAALLWLIPEIATEPPGFTLDEKLDKLGTHLRLPPGMESARSEIEKILPPIQVRV